MPAETPSVTLQQRLEPVYCLGDSHCNLFNYLLFDSPTGPLLCKSLFIRYFDAAHFMQAPGEIHPAVQQALEQEFLLHKAERMYDELQNQLILRRASQPPVVLVFCGYIDLHRLYQTFQNKYLIPGPHSPNTHSETGPDTGPDTPTGFFAESELNAGQLYVPYRQIESHVRNELQGIAQGLQWLKATGFRVALHELPPPGNSDHSFEQISGFACHFQNRLQLTRWVNRSLAEICQQVDVPLISLWDQVWDGKQLKSEYLLDGIHLNRAAATLSMQQLWQQFFAAPVYPRESALEWVARLETLRAKGQFAELWQEFRQQAQLLPSVQDLPAQPEAGLLELWGNALLRAGGALIQLQDWAALRQWLADQRHLLQLLLKTQAQPAQPAAEKLWIWGSAQPEAEHSWQHSPAFASWSAAARPLLLSPQPLSQAQTQALAAALPGNTLQWEQTDLLLHPPFLPRLLAAEQLIWQAPVAPELASALIFCLLQGLNLWIDTGSELIQL